MLSLSAYSCESRGGHDGLESRHRDSRGRDCRGGLPEIPSGLECECRQELIRSIRVIRVQTLSLAALHTEGAEDGSEDGDDEIDYFLNCFLFHFY